MTSTGGGAFSSDVFYLGRLLVVDDDRDIREALSDSLINDGYLVTLAVNGADALAQLALGPAPDLIVLDLTMPVLDGYGVLTKRATNPRCLRSQVRSG